MILGGCVQACSGCPKKLLKLSGARFSCSFPCIVVLTFSQQIFQANAGFVDQPWTLKKLLHLFFSFFNKVAGLRAFNFIKKKLQCSCFPVTFLEVLRTPQAPRDVPRTSPEGPLKVLTSETSWGLSGDS